MSSGSSGAQLPILTPLVYPMLAKVGRIEDVAGAVGRGYLVEPKIDGIRCLAVLVDGAIQLYNRQHVNITSRFPDVVDDIRLKVPGAGMLGRLVLDGEIYVRDDAGLPNFQLVQHRANRTLNIVSAAHDYPARYGVFDVLQSGVSYMGMPLKKRRDILWEICPQLVVASYTQEEADDLVVREVGEGLMLKQLSSVYVPGGRDASWLKIKWLRETEVVVGGVTHGIGKREGTFGGLLVGVYRPGDENHGVTRLVYTGTVGTGYTDAMLNSLITHLRAIRTDVCPFDNRASNWDTKFFVRPIMKARIRFAEYTRDGIMRFPRFVGL